MPLSDKYSMFQEASGQYDVSLFVGVMVKFILYTTFGESQIDINEIRSFVDLFFTVYSTIASL